MIETLLTFIHSRIGKVSQTLATTVGAFMVAQGIIGEDAEMLWVGIAAALMGLAADWTVYLIATRFIKDAQMLADLKPDGWAGAETTKRLIPVLLAGFLALGTIGCAGTSMSYESWPNGPTFAEYRSQADAELVDVDLMNGTMKMNEVNHSTHTEVVWSALDRITGKIVTGIGFVKLVEGLPAIFDSYGTNISNSPTMEVVDVVEVEPEIVEAVVE